MDRSELDAGTDVGVFSDAADCELMIVDRVISARREGNGSCEE
jgi:hypothetical protein